MTKAKSEWYSSKVGGVYNPRGVGGRWKVKSTQISPLELTEITGPMDTLTSAQRNTVQGSNLRELQGSKPVWFEFPIFMSELRSGNNELMY